MNTKTLEERIKNLLMTRRLCEAGAIIGGTALMFWWLIPRLSQWLIDMKEGYVPFIEFGTEG